MNDHVTNNIYESLGRLLKYPETDQTLRLDDCVSGLDRADSTALDPVRRFVEGIRDASLEQMQELYTRTFDINPVCALEVGWHLFGERYERGTFIVKMRQTLRQLGLTESAELPDHLPHVLEALGKMDADEAGEFASMFVLPAVEKMLAGFEGKDNVYSNVLDGICREIKSRHNLSAQGVNNG
ncbi:MAG: nitrate reductase molybdenum cofactor assembly chaperone [candidate division Zixibacteria bacterium]|nr:nitrate reductase molybdenum cofactor assembly chaperone [candidate division Zixibacteria bacterium]MDH3938200.1 nitrate reductase molybdenum cofactor assembly chaperone [candidate division Zixibacteria bacterium]